MSVMRGMKRNIAKEKAEKAGLSKICKHGKKDKSWFSIHWRSLARKGEK